MATVLKINGSVVDRPANRLAIDAVEITLDGLDSLEFTERAVRLPGSFTARRSAELIVDGTTVFKGEIVSAHYSGIGRGPIDVGYRALGLEWLANRVQVTAADGSGRLLYNLPRSDRAYQAANAGKSVGDMLKDLFDLHATQLGAIGVTGYDGSELAALVAVPPETVCLQGGLWNCARQLLYQWCNKYAAWIDPADGKIHVQSRLALAATTITLDSDPVVVDALSRDNSECFTRVANRGAARIEAAYLTLTRDATLVAGWTGTQQDDWSYADYLSPKDAADVGAVSSMSSTTLTVSSDDAARAWAANSWGPLFAEVVAYDPAATGITFSESRRITANTALSAGGTSVLTVDEPFSNSGYTRYSIRGLFAEDALVWRKFTIAPTYVAEHLAAEFSHAMPWSPQDGIVVQTASPQALICWSATCDEPWVEFPATFQIVPYDGVTPGYVVFDEPVLKPFGTMSKLIAGGAAVDGVPCEIKMMVPYSVGALSAAAPASGYEGTAYTADGLEATLYVDYPQWADYRDDDAYAILAQERLDTVKNTVVEGSFTYFGKLSALLGKGKAVNLAAATYTTGFESVAATATSVRLSYAPDGGAEGAGGWVTRVSFSNRMKPFAGDRLYTHPAFAAGADRRLASLDLAIAGRAAIDATPPAGLAEGLDGPLDGFPWLGGMEMDAGADAAPARRRRPARRLDGRSRLTRQVETDRANADDRESRRRVAERSNRRQSELLARARGGLVGPPKPGEVTPEAVAADERENQRRTVARASRRSAARLSNALGNPTGRRAPGQSEGDYQSDRDVDALLADRMRDDD